MEFYLDDEFEFAIEMIILSRNDNGATLSEIHDDFYKLFGVNFESIWGYKYWEEHFRQLLTNVMFNVYSKTLKQGCIVYYMNIAAAICRLADQNLPETMSSICNDLNIDLKKLELIEESRLQQQSTNQSRSSRSSRSTNKSNTSTGSGNTSTELRDCEFYGHSFISDDFFLDLALVDLNKAPSRKNKVQQVGQCISGQSIRSAVWNIPNYIDKLRDRVIINLGSFDLLHGKELIDMMSDMYRLSDILWGNNILPIVTTIPPLANHMHYSEMERKRKSFNQFLKEQFDAIDIEHCFLSTYGRIIFDLYQPEAKRVTGSRLSLVKWTHVGRQRVIKMLKRKIPEINNEFYY